MINTFEEISQCNPGALRICFAMLKEMDVVGCELWDLYKQCDKNIDKLHDAIMDKTATQKLSTVRGSKFYQEVKAT